MKSLFAERDREREREECAVEVMVEGLCQGELAEAYQLRWPPSR